MNKGTRVLDNGLVAEYRFLPGAYDKLEFNFKHIQCEAEENALLFYDGDKYTLRQYNDEEVEDNAKFMGHMTVVSNIPSCYNGTLNPTHTWEV